MRIKKEIVLENYAKKIEPLAQARQFYEDAQIVFEQCLDGYDKKDPEKFLPLFKPFEQSHGIEIDRMTRLPLGLYFKIEENYYYVSITDKKYEYKKLMRSDFYKNKVRK